MAHFVEYGALFRVRAKLPVANDGSTVLVRGIVDRYDLVRNGREAFLQIVDYKTGKAPQLKYSPAMNDKILQEALFQLKIYALLHQEQSNNGVPVRFLRLLYLTDASNKAATLDWDLGRTPQERDSQLSKVKNEIVDIWKQIVDLVDQQNAHAFVGCDRSFCYCHSCRKKYTPGSVWEPEVAQ